MLALSKAEGNSALHTRVHHRAGCIAAF